MPELRLSELAAWANGRILQGDPNLSFRRFNIDSRRTEPGELFFALQGQRDGHDFVADAMARGAAGAVVARPVALDGRGARFALVQVADTTAALQDLAAAVLRKQDVRVVAITGSAGKTTTKEFTAALLGREFSVLKSEGNLNNHLGLALSLLKLRPDQDVAVVEMAMNHAGEIARLVEIAPPDVAVITNINPVHLAFFRSLDDIAEAKREILQGTKRDGTAVLNGDDPRVLKIAQDWEGRKVLFGYSEACHVRGQGVRSRGLEGLAFDLVTGTRKVEVRLAFLYESAVANFLAAAAVAHAFGLDAEDVAAQALALKPLPRRGTLHRLKHGLLLVDDSYNSNPKALESALRALGRLPAGRRVAVLGDMLELGPAEAEFHAQAGRAVAAEGWNVLITIGPLGHHMAGAARSAGLQNSHILSFDTAEEAAGRMAGLLRPGDLVLVKGSHGIRTDEIADRILESFKES